MKNLNQKITTLFFSFMTLSLMANSYAMAQSSTCMELKGKPIIQWRAFKTPAKVGVLGTFTDVQRMSTKNKAKTLSELLNGQKVEINAHKIATGNEGRDENIVDNFFKKLKKNVIKATVKNIDAKKKTLNLEVILDGVKREVPMSYDFKDSVMKATGHIDVLDFALDGALKSINEACFTMHEGKTWSHVEVLLTQDLKDCQ
jgi:hypothetical protein